MYLAATCPALASELGCISIPILIVSFQKNNLKNALQNLTVLSCTLAKDPVVLIGQAPAIQRQSGTVTIWRSSYGVEGALEKTRQLRLFMARVSTIIKDPRQKQPMIGRAFGVPLHQ